MGAITKSFIKEYYWKTITSIIAIFGVFFPFTGEKLIAYYCDSNNPFLGTALYKFVDACQFYLTIGYVIVIAVVFFVFGVVCTLIWDLLISKTEKIFLLRAHPPMEYPPIRSRWASINIKNVSGEIIKNCWVDLVDVLDENRRSVLTVGRQRKLRWSSGDLPREANKDFGLDEEHVIDVATTFYSGNKKVTFDTVGGEETKDKGVYEVIIVVNGEIDGKPKKKKDIFTLTYYQRNIITIRRKGDPEWEPIDPRPPKNKTINKIKNPDHQSPSS